MAWANKKTVVANDNLYEENLDQFQLEWWATFRTFLIDNVSVYIWGNAPDLWRLWYVGGLQKSERLTLRNEIVWAKVIVKGHADAIGMSSPEMRGYPEQTERCLFFMIGEQGFNNNSDNYWEGWEPLRQYLFCGHSGFDQARNNSASCRLLCQINRLFRKVISNVR